MPTAKQKSLKFRLFFLVFCLVVWSCLIVFQLVKLQIVKYREMTNRSRNQQERAFDISSRRGTIYDRKHRALAASVEVDSMFAVPSEIADKEKTAEILEDILHINGRQLLKNMKRAKSFCWVKRKLDPSEREKVQKLNLPGIYFQEENKRFYPKRKLAAQVLGYVGMDNNGLGGLEYFYDKRVRGAAGRGVLMADGKQRSFSRLEKPPTAGDDLILTIDEAIQYFVETELEAQVKKSDAKGGTAIVMNPKTGEILAMANYPYFNPNKYKEYPSAILKNHAIVSGYDPGSTFKIFTVATAIEEGLTTSEEEIDCENGAIQIGKNRIHDYKPFGLLSVRDVLAHSSNVGVVKLGFRIGGDRLEKQIRLFGFGGSTDIDLPGEARGLLRPASDWVPIDLGNVSIGQGITVTPLQLVTAVSVIANGGLLVKPRVVDKISVERVLVNPSKFKASNSRVLRKTTSKILKEMMSEVVEQGTGRKAKLRGFSSAGKTGTAQKVKNGRYSHKDYIANFVGFAPKDDPAISILVLIDEPRGQYYGGLVAAPVFKEIAEKTLSYLSIPPDRPQDEMESPNIRNEELVVKDNEEEKTSQSAEVFFDDWMWMDQSKLSKSAEPNSNSSSSSNHGGSEEIVVEGAKRVEVPSFLGKSLRAVLSEGSRAGFQIQALGSGTVFRQNPLPNEKVVPGSIVKVQLQRNKRDS